MHSHPDDQIHLTENPFKLLGVIIPRKNAGALTKFDDAEDRGCHLALILSWIDLAIRTPHGDKEDEGSLLGDQSICSPGDDMFQLFKFFLPSQRTLESRFISDRD